MWLLRRSRLTGKPHPANFAPNTQNIANNKKVAKTRSCPQNSSPFHRPLVIWRKCYVAHVKVQDRYLHSF
jgi:hypothetical protein